MSQVIVYSQENGQVAVCSPTGEIPIEQVLIKDCPAGSIIIDESSLPAEHNDFFNAWELNGSTIAINLIKAKEIKKNYLRIERTPLLLAQDIAFQRALETGQDISSIVAEKQRLRDITKLADAANSIEELKEISI